MNFLLFRGLRPPQRAVGQLTLGRTSHSLRHAKLHYCFSGLHR
jgi:hypothetical protein